MLQSSPLHNAPSLHLPGSCGKAKVSKRRAAGTEPQPATMIFTVDSDAEIRRRIVRAAAANGLTARAFSTAEQFLAENSQESAGCLVLETQLAGMSGLDLQDELLRRQSKLSILFLSAAGTASQAAKAIRNGAIDFMRKPIDQAELGRFLRTAAVEDRARRSLAESKTTNLRRYESLAFRELQVLRHVLDGRPNKAIGRLLSISDKAVETHRRRMMQKLQCKTLADLVRLCGGLFGWQFDHIALLARQEVAVVIHRDGSPVPFRGTATYERHNSLGAVLRISLDCGVPARMGSILISEREWRGRIETGAELRRGYSLISPLGRGCTAPSQLWASAASPRGS